VDPVLDPLLLRKSGSVGGSQPGPLDLYPGTLIIRSQRFAKYAIRKIVCGTDSLINSTRCYLKLALNVRIASNFKLLP
jgi:hypothetical protein